MSITLTPFDHGELCYGWSWTVQDEALLADQIARVALGQARHVAKILAGAQLGPPQTSAAAVANAVAMLIVIGPDPSHRDGWMFQVISWIAANRATPGAIIHPPHMILAHKGFDGLQLELDKENGRVVAAIIFEDKATDNPRDIVPQLIRRESLEGLFGTPFKGLEDDEARGQHVLPTLEQMLTGWMAGHTLVALERTLGVKEHLLRRCEHAREFALRIGPELAYIFGLPAQVFRDVASEAEGRLACTVDRPCEVLLGLASLEEGFSQRELAMDRHPRRPATTEPPQRQLSAVSIRPRRSLTPWVSSMISPTSAAARLAISSSTPAAFKALKTSPR